MTNRAWILAGLAASLLVFPAVGYADDDRDDRSAPRPLAHLTLHEISERVTFDPDPSHAGLILRNAVAPLLGFAELGTPLCPSELLIAVPRMRRCTVIATGRDSISTVDGLGPVTGDFDVVINAPGNSSVHVPNLPVIHGTFDGNVDLSLAVINHIPLGSIIGSFTVTATADPRTGVLVPLSPPVVLPFSGTFRLPFGIGDHHEWERSDHGRPAFYLADNLRTRIRIRSNELSIGFATVRLEVTFGQ